MNKLVFHGSKEAFAAFAMDKIDLNDEAKGIGFYFADSEEVAEAYAENGYFYTVLLTINKPLYDDILSFSKRKLKYLLVAMDEELGYLSNWGDIASEGYEKVLTRAVNEEYNSADSDMQLINSLCYASGHTRKVLELVHKKTGYDAILRGHHGGRKPTSYIAMTPEIISILSIQKIKPETGNLS